jgi:putative ABC transport system substrate-binding protein
MIEEHWADGRYERLASLAGELVNRNVALIVAISLPAAIAAKAATSTIPIVFIGGADPVQFGLAASHNRPGGNLTGVTQVYGALGAKRLELLRELIPRGTEIAVLSNPNNPNHASHFGNIEAAAAALGHPIYHVLVSRADDLDGAFASVAQRRGAALLVSDDPLFTGLAEALTAQAARRAIPAMYYLRDFVDVGGLMAYGPVRSNNYRQAGIYAGRILKGVKPADLPIVQPTEFELVVNLKAAKTLGVTIPRSILLRADEVIE